MKMIKKIFYQYGIWILAALGVWYFVFRKDKNVADYNWDAYIVSCYQKYIKRDPGPTEVSAWIRDIMAGSYGADVDSVKRNIQVEFTKSSEYKP